MSNGVFNFNFLALVFSEILGGSQIYTRGSNCVFNFNILALVVSDILGGSQIYVRGPCAPSTPLAEIFFVPEASTLVCLMAFLISTF